MDKKKYLVALPTWIKRPGFNHPTILVSAEDETDAIDLVRYIKGNVIIGDIKEVIYGQFVCNHL